MAEWWVVAAIACAVLSGMPGAVLPRGSAAGERIATALMLLGGILGVAGGIRAIFWPSVAGITVPWSVPGGALSLRVDGISAMFVIQIFAVAALGSIYGLGYWSQADRPNNGRKLRLFYGLMTAGMVTLAVARNTVLFLAGWEVMALSAFLTITTEDEERPVREVGYLYLVATRVSTLALFAIFALLYGATGAFDFDAGGLAARSATGTAIFLLALFGFGLKAGIMPLHIWLPGAHARAPSHVSALMSGVLIKMGIYGLVRITAGFAHPPLWWGVVVLVLGVVSGILGVAFAIGQHDIKRLLAYHSVENIGIIWMGLGIALIGRSLDQPGLVVLGLAGALLHVWNHGLFKALLFLSAGSVIHATGTREIDQLGGLQKRMPWTALCFLVGAVAICGLPPLNGFVSELLVYLGFFRSVAMHEGRWWLMAAFAAPALALVGALAVACFVKVFGAVFLGVERSRHATSAHEAPRSMTGPMVVLAACCLFIGLGPVLVAPVLDGAVAAWAPGIGPHVASSAPLGWISISGSSLAVALLCAAAWLKRRAPAPDSAVTWDCGYVAPSPRMQYTSSSFAQIIVRIFSFALRPKVHEAHPHGPFPKPAGFHSHVGDAVLDEAVFPTTRTIARAFQWMRWIQRGTVHLYLTYILLTLILMLVWR
jgi:hydrogenase-4 component B